METFVVRPSIKSLGLVFVSIMREVKIAPPIFAACIFADRSILDGTDCIIADDPVGENEIKQANAKIEVRFMFGVVIIMPPLYDLSFIFLRHHSSSSIFLFVLFFFGGAYEDVYRYVRTGTIGKSTRSKFKVQQNTVLTQYRVMPQQTQALDQSRTN